jgi:hypothetical protein
VSGGKYWARLKRTSQIRPFLEKVFPLLPDGCIVSLEGDLDKVSIGGEERDATTYPELRRQEWPRCDFRVLRFTSETERSILRCIEEGPHPIEGYLRHMLFSSGGRLIAEMYDSFEDWVLTGLVDGDTLALWQAEGLISDWREET